MNKDQIRGKWEELKGKFKKGYGDTTADRKAQVEGGVQEGAGKVQQGFGNLKEDIKDIGESVRRPPDDASNPSTRY